MPPEEGARLVTDLTGALTQARRNGVHDRVTVENVAIDSTGRAHLRDFGLRFIDTNELTELGNAGGDSTGDQADLAGVLEFAITGGSPLADAGLPRLDGRCDRESRVARQRIPGPRHVRSRCAVGGWTADTCRDPRFRQPLQGIASI